MADESLLRREERRSIITLVRNGPSCLPPMAVESSDTEDTYPMEFNAAFWSGSEWTVNLGETLSLPEMRTMTQTRLVQCAHLFSDAVVFLASDPLSATTIYLKWLACCPAPGKNQLPRPAATIILEEAPCDTGAFLRQCAARPEAGVFTFAQLETGFFDNVHIEQVKPFAWKKDPSPHTLVHDVALEHIRDSQRNSRRFRANHGRLWTLSDYRQLVSAWEATGHMPDAVSLLTNPWPSRKHSLSSILSSVRCNDTPSSQNFETMLTQMVTLVGSYLTRHSFRSRHWTGPGEHSRTNIFAEDQFKLRYLPLVRRIACDLSGKSKQLMPRAGFKRYSSDTLVAMIKNCWLDNSRMAYQTCISVLESAQLHIELLRPHRGYLATREYGNSCAACLLESWAHMLPCRHGLCTLCLRACHGKEMAGCRMDVYECPVCEQNIESTCIRKFMPTTATLRVLALDGGGIKGLVQLQILKHLLDKTGLREAIHISSFFDLMVGSSIGGICALGLGTRNWSLEDCKTKFIKFTEQLFVPKSRCTRLLSRLSGGWSDVLFNTARLIFFDSIYDSAPIERILMESFDDTSSMIQTSLEHSSKVAVVVNQASTSETTVFTNYNKSRHRKTGAYRWPEMGNTYQSLRIWEVARATSAAPGFWKSVTLLGKVYQDGGLSHNNPSAIAINEANLLASLHHTDPLVVSVGCGRLFTAPLTGTSVFKRYLKVFEESLNAERQHDLTKMLRNGRMEDLVRLNPRLHMNEVSLDEQSSISSLDSSVQAVLDSDSISAQLFSAKCETAARRLIASLFYFELGYKLRKGEKHGNILQVGIIKTHLTEQEFERFRKIYPTLRLRVEDVEVEVSAATEVEISHTISTDSFKIELVHPSWVHQISGSPFTIAQLREAQSDYLPVALSEGRKRKRG